MSVDFYDQQADSFADNTLSVDMTALYAEFLPLLAPGSLVIDAGCGAGRDSRYFLAKGFKVIAFDASQALVAIAKQVTGLPVIYSTFLAFNSSIKADALWACASLLHVPWQEQQATFRHLAKMVKPKGLIYCSYKYGNHDHVKDGRQFTNANETRLEQFIADSGLRVKKCWLTADARPGRADEQWLNAILENTA
jgi:2-polyprenyl-3-methyl-5-hydroxy-6-metoxy-1,4-benzoquinol methylase